MINKSIPSYQFAPEDASGMAREWSGIASALPRKLFALLFCLLFVGVGNVWGQVNLTYEWTVTAGQASLPSGVSHSGLGSDYASSNAPYYLKFDTQGDYIQIYTNAAASEVKFTVKMIGGSATSKFKVQGCATASGSYTDIQEFTCSGAQNDIKTFTTSNSISSTYRYFRIIKSVHGSNVGLGYVKITKMPVTATITLNNYTGSASTTGYYEDDDFTLPGTNSYTCGTKIFVGWSTVEVAETNTKPTSNFYEPGEDVTLGATNTFYAVFATSGSSSKTYAFNITASDFNKTSYAANNNEKTSTATATDASGATMSVNWTSNQIMLQSSAMQWQKSNGYIYNSTDLGTINSVTVTSSAGTFTTYYGTTSQPSSGTQGTGKGYFKTSVGSATGSTSNVAVNFTKTTTTYSNYATTCCTSLGSINGSFF